MLPVLSPWHETFEDFARSIRQEAVIVAPFITEPPLRRLASLLCAGRRPQINVLTNLSEDSLLQGSVDGGGTSMLVSPLLNTEDSLLQGSVDGGAIADFCRAVPTTTVRHLPGLHAKAYVADDHTAIVTSGNLTAGSMFRNYEYGIRITDPPLVRRIASDLLEYGSLGTPVSIAELDNLAGIAQSLRDKHSAALRSASTNMQREFEEQLATAQETLRQLRARPGESTNSIFARTILHILSNGPLTTEAIHPLVQNIHPDLCDDSIDRVINGVHFGVRWKHLVRRAQQHLRDSGRIERVGGEWRLVKDE